MLFYEVIETARSTEKQTKTSNIKENKKMFKTPHNPKVDSSSLSPATSNNKGFSN